MRKWMKMLAALLVLLLLSAAIIANTLADFGDFSGSSDYGGDYGGSYDSYDSYDYGGSYDFSNIGFMEIFLFVVICVLLPNRSIRKALKKRGFSFGHHARGPQAPGAAPTTGLQPVDTIFAWDPAFSPDAITRRLSNLYVQMQNCWTAKDITPLRGDFTDEQFAQYDRQLQRYRDEGQTPVVERIAVLGVSLTGVKQSDVHDILVANLSTRITTYTVNDRTGAVVRGSKTEEKFMRYEWTLVRPKGAQTARQDGDCAFNCPNCSAPVNINQSAQCPYCGSVITKADYDWVISGIKGLSQQTGR